MNFVNPVEPPPQLLEPSVPDASPDGQLLGERVIPLIEERLEISRRVVDTGRTLRVRKVVDEEVVAVDEPVMHQFVDVERVTVGRVLTGPVQVRHEGDVMVIPVVEERLVVSRELVLTEEIRVTQRREQRRSTESVTLRRERVIIERFDPGLQAWAVVDDGEAAALAPGPDPPASTA